MLKQVCEAVNTISDVAQGRSATMNDNGNQIYDGPGELAAALDDFDVIINLCILVKLERIHSMYNIMSKGCHIYI